MKREQINKVLTDINRRANEKFGDKLFTEVRETEILAVFDERLKQDMPEWKRKYYKAMRKEFDKPKVETNEEVAKQFDNFVDKEIKKAIKDGKLPKKYVQTTKDA